MYVYSAWAVSNLYPMGKGRAGGQRAAAPKTQHGASGFTEKIESVPGDSIPPFALCGLSLCISCGQCAELRQ
jgi:hypothetical protein